MLTSYALLPRDLVALRKQPFALIVLDEAQQVKNPRTQARRALLSLRTPRYVCLTGTPLENHLGELWSQIDLAVPGLLGDEGAFRRYYRVPIEKQHDEECQAAAQSCGWRRSSCAGPSRRWRRNCRRRPRSPAAW